MIRLAINLTLVTAMLASCAGPIETRVQTISNAEPTKNKSYMFAEGPEQSNEIYGETKKRLRDALETKGFQHKLPALFVVDFAVANRPASIAIKTGESENSAVIAEPKQQRLLQSCNDNEHRLIVTIFYSNAGKQYYRGTASEYHCKGTLEQSLPHLVKAALTDLNRAGDGQIQQKTLMRAGLD